MTDCMQRPRLSTPQQRELQKLIDEDPFYPDLILPPHLRACALPAHIVLLAEPPTPVMRKLRRLCRRAFKPYLLNDWWFNNRRFVESDFRTPVEFVPDFARLVPFVDCGEEGAALNLRRVADGLLELLEHFEPAKPRAVVVRLQDSLLRPVRRLIREELSAARDRP